jgi:hypothetical protein
MNEAQVGEVRGFVEQAALDAAERFITSGAFDDAISEVIVDAVRFGKDEGLSQVGFVLKMAVELIDRSRPKLGFAEAKRRASKAYHEFLRDNRIKFGDAEWDWSGRGARAVTFEYEIAHWEQT